MRLAMLLEVDDPDIVLAKLVRLWLWAVDYCPNGRLSVADRPISAREIASASGWRGDPDLWMKSLVEVGWIDEKKGGPNGKTLYLHDWHEYAGKLIQIKEKDRRRKRRGNPTEFRRNSDGIPSEIQPYRTGPDRTGPNQGGESPPTPPCPPSPSASPSDGGAPPPSDPPQEAPSIESVADAYRAVDPTIPRGRACEHIRHAVAAGVPLERIAEEAPARARRGYKLWETLDDLRNALVREAAQEKRRRRDEEAAKRREDERRQREERLAAREKLDRLIAEAPEAKRAAWRKAAEEEAEKTRVKPKLREAFLETRVRLIAAKEFGLEEV